MNQGAAKQPILAHAWMSAREAVEACGLRYVRLQGWTFRVVSPAGETLYQGTPRGVLAWLRRERWIQ